MKKLSLTSLVLLIVAAIDSIRNLPAAAIFGTPVLFFFFVLALIFLFPTALVAAELTATYSEKGGIYHWVQIAFGEKTGMIAIWMQWINTMLWYPTILLFIASTAAYLFHPDLAENKIYLCSIVLGVFWLLTFLNLFGIHFSSKINNYCVTLGTMIPLLFLIVLGLWWIFSSNAVQVELTPSSFIPTFSSSTSWTSIIAIMASFLGMELAGVHVNDIRNPQKNFPRALWISSVFLLTTMAFGSLAIAVVVPAENIQLASGVMQVVSTFCDIIHAPWIVEILAGFIIIGAIGSIINWLISPAKGLLHAAEHKFLPSFFVKKNKYNVPSRILIGQACVVTVFCLALFTVPTINSFYWFLTAVSTELYMVMYVLMFFAALRLHYTHKTRGKLFKIPGKTTGIWIVCLTGLTGCIMTIAVTFIPSSAIDPKDFWNYQKMIILANIVAILPLFLFYAHKRRQSN